MKGTRLPKPSLSTFTVFRQNPRYGLCNFFWCPKVQDWGVFFFRKKGFDFKGGFANSKVLSLRRHVGRLLGVDPKSQNQAPHTFFELDAF